MDNPYEIVMAPVVTEKAMRLGQQKKYAFKVHPAATKVDIRRAIERIFPDVKVKKVNTLYVRGKERRWGRLPTGTTARWKKAIVTLSSGSIEIFETAKTDEG